MNPDGSLTLTDKLIKSEYKAVAISTADVPPHDMHNLKHMDSGMVMERDTGFFIKLYEEPEYNMQEFQNLTFRLNTILQQAHYLGYRMVEIDCDAEPVMGHLDEVD